MMGLISLFNEIQFMLILAAAIFRIGLLFAKLTACLFMYLKGSVYEKVNIQQEINVNKRDKFWSKQEVSGVLSDWCWKLQSQ